jgi:hypothetical protein
MRFAILIFVAFILASCAQQGVPGGGPKDVTGPKVVLASPDNYSLEYSSSEVTLEFDEFVRTSKLSNELLVTPVPDEDPEIKMSGKKVTLSFPSGLTPNTTYTLNFGEGIVDYNESNPLDSNLWIFSTGSFLDSGFIAGNVLPSFEEELEGDFWVILYDGEKDSLPYYGRPNYLTKASEAGAFRFDFLRSGDYKIFVLDDINNNYQFDLPDEQIAFLSSRVNTGNDSLEMIAFREDLALQYVVEPIWKGEMLKLVMNKEAREPIVRRLGSEDPLELFRASQALDTLSYWLKGWSHDSIVLDVSDGDYRDTLEVGRGEDFEFSLSVPKKVIREDGLDIQSNCSFADSMRWSVLVRHEKDTFLTEARWNSEFSFHIPIDSAPAGKIELWVMPDSSVETCPLRDSLQFQSNVLHREELMRIVLKTDLQGKGWIDLIGEGDKILQRCQLDQGLASFSDLIPGRYKARLVSDLNENGFWDSGRYLEGRQAEPVWYFPGVLELQQGFDLEQEWLVTNPE